MGVKPADFYAKVLQSSFIIKYSLQIPAFVSPVVNTLKHLISFNGSSNVIAGSSRKQLIAAQMNLQLQCFPSDVGPD